MGSDKGIRRMVLPVLSKNKTSSLSYLDVSFNKLNEKSIKRMMLVPKLDTVIIGEEDLKNAESCFQPHFTKKTCPRLVKVETSGFGSILLDKWKQKISDTKKSRALSTASSFYSSSILLKETVNTNPSSIKEIKRGNKIMFSRSRSKIVPKTISKSVSFKRSFICDTEQESQKKKTKITVSDFTNCDQDLLSLYS